MACRGEASTSILAHAELKVQHTHSQQLCASTVPKGLGRDTNPWCFQRSSSRKAPHKLQAHRALCSWHKGGQCGARSWSCSLGLQQRVHLAGGKCHSFSLKFTYVSFLLRSPNKAQKRAMQPLCLGPETSCPEG